MNNDLTKTNVPYKDPWLRLALVALLTPLGILFLAGLVTLLAVMIGLIGWVILALLSGPVALVLLAVLYFVGISWRLKKMGFAQIVLIAAIGALAFVLSIGYYVYFQDIDVLKLLVSMCPWLIGDQESTRVGLQPALVASIVSALGVLITAWLTNKNLR